ncbi:MAG: phage tail tube protein [Candidatus Micrarchaeia archaeon]
MAILADLSSYGAYAEEATYADDTGLTVTSTHGIGKSISEDLKNNLVYHYGIGGGRSPLQVKAGILEASFETTFKVQNGTFLKHVLGARTGSGTSGSPYAYAVANAPASLTYEVGHELGTTDRAVRYLGSMCQSARFRVAEKEEVTASMGFIAKTIKKGTTFQTIIPSSDAIYNFSNGALEYGSTPFAEIVSAEWNILNHAENYYEIGSRLGKGIWKTREFLGTIRARTVDSYWMDKFLDGGTGSTTPSTGTPTAVASMRLNLTDGTRYIYAVLSNIYVDNWKGTVEQGNVVEEDIQVRALGCSATEVI